MLLVVLVVLESARRRVCASVEAAAARSQVVLEALIACKALLVLDLLLEGMVVVLMVVGVSGSGHRQRGDLIVLDGV